MDDLKTILQHYDDNVDTPFDEAGVSSKIKGLENSTDNNNWFIYAERIAFDFTEDYQKGASGWGTYFGPLAVFKKEDGNYYEYPSFAQLEEKIIDYWESRGKEAKHPLFIARYLDLVWDFSTRVSGKKPKYEICEKCISAYIEIAENKLAEHAVTVFTKLKRALSLSLSINNRNLIEYVVKTIIQYEDDVSDNKYPGLWGNAFDYLIVDNPAIITSKQEQYIISQLELRLQQLSDIESKSFDPISAEKAVTRLASYYTKKQQNDDVLRVLYILKNAYKTICEKADPLQASGWYEIIIDLFHNYGLRSHCLDFVQKLREIGPRIEEQMSEISAKVELPAGKIEDFVNSLIQGDFEQDIIRVATQFVPKIEDAKNELLQLSKKHPVQYLFGTKIQGEGGIVSSTVPSIQEDLGGHLVLHLSKHISMDSLFLKLAINKMRESYRLSSSRFIKYIKESPIIDSDKIQLVKKGLSNYVKRDYLSSVHLLIPQIENACRRLLEYSGGNILVKNKSGGFDYKSFDSVLRELHEARVFGGDIFLYFRVLYTDRRALNLRNKVCHGLLDASYINETIANHVLHSILCIGLIRKDE